ncbi:hypothetical protein DOTSEDRAFT_71347 [Dothistroma septosporum NZE10]|uniref:Uncharacterized protein n=1 Tax=Dothistroma septosporum (strain NZE10 / CBS 128990) TaxID=675120 RepID=N1PQG2_DOTSN|nr:hypothetical protein DOTSEDRAFT_71347 [Dothistroma septosporum NZE10]
MTCLEAGTTLRYTRAASASLTPIHYSSMTIHRSMKSSTTMSSTYLAILSLRGLQTDSDPGLHSLSMLLCPLCNGFSKRLSKHCVVHMFTDQGR